MTKKPNLKVIEDVPRDPVMEARRLNGVAHHNAQLADACEARAKEARRWELYALAEVAKYKAETMWKTGEEWATALSNQRTAEGEAAQRSATAADAERKAKEYHAVAERALAEIEEVRASVAQAVTRDDVLAVCRNYCKHMRGGRDFVFKVFAKYGANGLNEVKPEHYAAIIEEIGVTM